MRLKEPVIEFEEAEVFLEEKLVAEVTQLSLEQMVTRPMHVELSWVPPFTAHNDWCEILASNELAKLRPQSRVLGETGLSQGPHSLCDTFCMQVLSLLLDYWYEQFLIYLKLSLVVALENVECISCEGYWEIRHALMFKGLKHIKHIA